MPSSALRDEGLKRSGRAPLSLMLPVRIASAPDARFVEQAGGRVGHSWPGDRAGPDLRQQVRGQPDLLQRADTAFDQLLQEEGRFATARLGQEPEPTLDGRIDSDRHNL